MLKDSAARADTRGTLRQRVAPLSPLLTVELFERCASLALMFDLAGLQNLEQGMSGMLGCIGTIGGQFHVGDNLAAR